MSVQGGWGVGGVRVGQRRSESVRKGVKRCIIEFARGSVVLNDMRGCDRGEDKGPGGGGGGGGGVTPNHWDFLLPKEQRKELQTDACAFSPRGPRPFRLSSRHHRRLRRRHCRCRRWYLHPLAPLLCLCLW